MELILVSGKPGLIGQSCELDLCFHLNRMPNIPRPHTARPWNRTKMSPFRDRLMIEWVFSQREALKELYNIITSVNEKIQPKNKRVNPSDFIPASKTLIVGITCVNGYELSPCFVELLYNHYITNPPIDLLIVKRNHLNALNLSHLKPEKLVWQQLPTGSLYSRKKKFDNSQQINLLTSSRDWSDIPFDLNTKLETAFAKDPFGNNVQIGDIIIDFEGGYIHTKTTGQQSFLRCTLLPVQAEVKVRSISHKTYKLFIKSYEAAGILPYSFHPVSREPIFLVGRITYGGATWCDFGGLKTRYKVIRETPAETAARECYEESLGVFGTYNQLLKNIRDFEENNVFKIINENSSYVGHFLRIPFDHYPSRFATLSIENLSMEEGLEVSAIRWLPLSSIKRAIHLALSGARRVRVQAISESDGNLDSSSSLQLRTEFACSLCIADEFGVFDSIVHIGSMLNKGIREDIIHLGSGDLNDTQEDTRQAQLRKRTSEISKLEQETNDTSTSVSTALVMESTDETHITEILADVHIEDQDDKRLENTEVIEYPSIHIETESKSTLSEVTDDSSSDVCSKHVQPVSNTSQTGFEVTEIPFTDIPDRQSSPILLSSYNEVRPDIDRGLTKHDDGKQSKTKTRGNVTPMLLFGMASGTFCYSYDSLFEV